MRQRTDAGDVELLIYESSQNEIRLGNDPRGIVDFGMRIRSGGNDVVQVSTSSAQFFGFTATESQLQSTNNTGFKTSGIYMNSAAEQFSLGDNIWFENGQGAIQNLDIAGQLNMLSTGSIYLKATSGQDYNNASINNDRFNAYGDYRINVAQLP